MGSVPAPGRERAIIVRSLRDGKQWSVVRQKLTVYSLQLTARWSPAPAFAGVTILGGHDILNHFFRSIDLHTEIDAGTPSQGEGANEKEGES